MALIVSRPVMFQYLSQLAGFPIDQVKYFTCFLLSFPLALILRVILSYKTTSVTIRNAYCAGSGILLCVLCFDWSTIYLIMYAGIPYAMLYLIRRDVVQWYILGFCYIGLGYCHTYRMITSYGQYNLDLTTPLMVIMQRITYIGFCYHDGGQKEDELSEDQKANKITNRPTLLEYFSFVFSFYSVLTGPSTPYILHDDFITGRNIERHLINGKMLPSNVLVVLKKAGMAGVYLMINLMVTSFDLESVILHDQSLFLPLRIVYVAIFSFGCFCMYYFVWSLIESISNLAGLGFNGFDEIGKPKWDLVNNFNLYVFHFDTLQHRVKEFNCLTVQWLRRIIYDRVDEHKNYWTFAASIVWHGFYPGYFYISLQVIPLMEAARRLRYHVQPLFQSSRILRLVYSIASSVLLTIVHHYTTLAFLLLEHRKVYKIWKYYYFAPLFASVATILLLPPAKRRKHKHD